MELPPKEPEQFRLKTPQAKRIYRRLSLIGPGPATFYLDACRLMEGRPELDSTTHLVAHLLREVESAMRDVLEPLAERAERITAKTTSQDNHAIEIQAILRGLEIPETDTVLQLWLGLVGKGNTSGLSSRAHRDALAVPRSLDTSFRKFWEEAQTILDLVLEKFESRYLVYVGLLDELLAKNSPSQEDLRRLRNHVPNNLV